jgi:hypothetical protein
MVVGSVLAELANFHDREHNVEDHLSNVADDLSEETYETIA